MLDTETVEDLKYELDLSLLKNFRLYGWVDSVDMEEHKDETTESGIKIEFIYCQNSYSCSNPDQIALTVKKKLNNKELQILVLGILRSFAMTVGKTEVVPSCGVPLIVKAPISITELH